jgi:hypothetical protein
MDCRTYKSTIPTAIYLWQSWWRHDHSTEDFVIRICEDNSGRPLMANYDTPNITAVPLRAVQATPARPGSLDRSPVAIDPVAVPVETRHGLSRSAPPRCVTGWGHRC